MHCMEDFILWFDLETTGTGAHDQVIEFGAVVTDRALKVLGDYDKVYPVTNDFPLLSVSPHVLQMHVANNLWDACHKAHYEEAGVPFAHKESQEDILRWLGDNGWMPHGRIVSAGSGVSHFDRRFLMQYAPALNKRLTYWNLDIGVMRRLLRLMNIIGDEEWLVEGEGNHRALDDAYRALEETRAYRDLLMRKDDPRDLF